MKAAVVAFVLSVTAPMHLTVAALGVRVCVPVPWLILAAEVAAFAGLVWLIVRALRSSRSSPYPRTGWRAA